MTILGISAFYHDSAASIIRDGEIIAAAQEERFTRKKHDAGFPENAIRFCLDFAGCSLRDLDAVVYYDKPFLKFERLLETYYAFAPKGLWSFVTAIPVWIKEKLFLKRMLFRGLRQIEKIDRKKIKLLFTEHHLSHAASCFYPSNLEQSAILTIDGVGEWATASICLGEGKNITILKELHFPHSLGLLYSAFTYYCGFKVNSGEYKLMGLAPYGDPEADETHRFIKNIRDHLIDVAEDGSLFLYQEYFRYATGTRMTRDRKWIELFGLPRRKQEEDIHQSYCNLALAIQTITDEIVIKMAREAKRLTQADSICMAGGVALNCVSNGKLQELNLFKQIYIQPAAGDAGGALGASLAAYHIYFEQPRLSERSPDLMKGGLLGNQFEEKSILSMAIRESAVFKRFEKEEELLDYTAILLSQGKIIGWHQGRMEFGPRALGARSILADPRDSEMQRKLNLHIKFRESFRPFAPAVMAEDAQQYFEMAQPSPYMLFVKPVQVSRRMTLPSGYSQWPLPEKLYYKRSDLPAITHIDFSARVQTVDRKTHPLFWGLLNAFKKITGYGVLINTSFNVRGEPIVNTPEDAYQCFMNTEMDYLVMGPFIFDKKEQPPGSKNNDKPPTLALD